MLHKELEKAGIFNVFEKMEMLNHEHIHLAIQKYRDEVEADSIYEEMDIYQHLDVYQICQLILKGSVNTPYFQSLHHILACLLKIQDNPEKRYKFDLL